MSRRTRRPAAGDRGHAGSIAAAPAPGFHAKAQAVLGGAAWILLAVLSLRDLVDLNAYELLFLVAPLVAFPLAFALLGALDAAPGPLDAGRAAAASLPRTKISSASLRVASVLLPLGAAGLVVSFLMPPGLFAAALTAPWLAVATATAIGGLSRLVRLGRVFRGGDSGAAASRPGLVSAAAELALAVGSLYFAYAAVMLALSRAGAQPCGFLEPIVLLTAVHFHFAGFIAPVLVAATGLHLSRGPNEGSGEPSIAGRFYPYVAAGVVGSPAILAAGWVLDLPAVKLAGATLLAASHAVFAAMVLAILPSLSSRAARLFVGLSAASIGAAMILAAVYATGEYLERQVLSIPRMAFTHGVLDALGFSVCGVLGWLAESARGERLSHAPGAGTCDSVTGVLAAGTSASTLRPTGGAAA